MAEYKYHAVNEAVLEATPAEIIAAYADEFAGRSSWWLPRLRARVRDQVEYPQVGAVLDVEVSVRPGGVNRRDATKFTERVTAYEPERRIVVTTDGALCGETEITLTPVDETHTRIREDWRANPAGLWGLLLRFLDVEAHNTTVTQAGFKAMGGYIAANRTTSA